MLGSLIGLALFNLFMVIPADVYASLLGTVYISALLFTRRCADRQRPVGPERTGAGRATAPCDEFTNSHFDSDEEQQAGEGWRVSINSMGVQLHQDTESPRSQARTTI
jgi:hypothetical protein